MRTACGLFDVSHMGEIICEGEYVLININMLLSNDYTDLDINHAAIAQCATNKVA